MEVPLAMQGLDLQVGQIIVGGLGAYRSVVWPGPGCRWQGSATADSRGQCPSPVGIRWRPVLLAVEPLRPHRSRIASRRIGRLGLRVLRSQLQSPDVAVALAATCYESCRGMAPCHRVDTKVEHQHPACRPVLVVVTAISSTTTAWLSNGRP